MQTEPSPRQAVPVPTRRGLSRVEAAGYVGVSATTFDRLVGEAKMPKPKRIFSRLVWDVRALDLAFDSLADESDSQNTWDERWTDA